MCGTQLYMMTPACFGFGALADTFAVRGNPINGYQGTICHHIQGGGNSEPLAMPIGSMRENGRILRVNVLNGSTKIRQKIQQYADLWTEYANIKFQFIDSGDAEIRLNVDSSGGFGPYVGTLNLTDSTNESEFARVITHEFGRALGCILNGSSTSGNTKLSEMDKSGISNGDCAKGQDKSGISNGDCAKGQDKSGISNGDCAKSQDKSGISNGDSAKGQDKSGISNGDSAEGQDKSGISNGDSAKGQDKSGISNGDSAEGQDKSGISNGDSAEGQDKSVVHACPAEGQDKSGICHACSAKGQDKNGISNGDSAESQDKSVVHACPAEGQDKSGISHACPAEGQDKSGSSNGDSAESQDKSVVHACPAEGQDKSGISHACPVEGQDKSGISNGDSAEGQDKSDISNACPVEGPNIGSFNTMEVREWNKPTTATKKTQAFPADKYKQPPSLSLGLNWLDISNAANIRVLAFADNITKDKADLHLNTWSNTTLYSAGCTWLEVAANDPDFQVGRFSTLDDHIWEKPQANTSRHIKFGKPFSSPPKVVVWLNKLDMSKDHNSRVKAYTTDITATGFTIHLDSWADTLLYGATADWIAYPSSRTGICSGRISTADHWLTNKPQLLNSGTVAFPEGTFSKPPTIVLAFDSLDMARTKNIRLKVRAESVSQNGMTWHIDSWWDSIFYKASASYIALA